MDEQSIPAEVPLVGHTVEPVVVRLSDSVTLIHGDCRDCMPIEADAVITDPPYPSWLTKEYNYTDGLVDVLERQKCRQFVFWTPSSPFPLSYGGKRIWDKAVGTNTQFEEIYERNGKTGYKVHRHYIINSTVAASFTRDIYTGHPSQKPIALITTLAEELPQGVTVLDPFMGSGTTGIACIRTGRKFIGIELDAGHFATARARLERELAQGLLDFGGGAAAPTHNPSRQDQAARKEPIK